MIKQKPRSNATDAKQPLIDLLLSDKLSPTFHCSPWLTFRSQVFGDKERFGFQ